VSPEVEAILQRVRERCSDSSNVQTASHLMALEAIVDGYQNTVVFSRDMKYRYLLQWEWDPTSAPLIVVMLNPSTADHLTMDPTIRRVVALAKRHGFGSVIVVNIAAFRATDPKDLVAQHKLATTAPDADVPNIWGSENWEFLMGAFEVAPELRMGSKPILVGWGAHEIVDETGAGPMLTGSMMANKITPFCLGKTKSGAPKHPLYIANSVDPEPWLPLHYHAMVELWRNREFPSRVA